MAHQFVMMATVGSWYGSNVTTIQTVLVDALLAFSVQLCLRAGVFSLASVAFWSLGGYVAGILAKHGQSAPVIVVVVAVSAVVVGSILSLGLGRLKGLYLAMATVALDLVVIVVITNAGSLTGGAEGLFAIPVKLSTLSVAAIVAVAIAFLALSERGNVGRAIRVLRGDPDVAAALGFRVRLIERSVFVASALLGALSGASYSLLFTTIQPTQGGFPLIVTGLTVIVLGGMDTWIGALVGSVIVVWLPLWITPIGNWTGVVYGASIIVVVLLAPRGIAGLASDGLRQLLRAVRPGARTDRSEGAIDDGVAPSLSDVVVDAP